jgi:hypothetical protein
MMLPVVNKTLFASGGVAPTPPAAADASAPAEAASTEAPAEPAPAKSVPAEAAAPAA